MSDERYIKLLTEINKYGLDKGCAVEVMAVHNATGQTVKQLCGMHEKEVLQQLIEGYLFQKEQRSKLEAENAAMRERLEKAAVPPCKIGDVLYTVTVAFADGWVSDTIIRRSAISLSETVVTEKNIWRMCELIRIGKAFFSKEAAETRLKELQGGKE